MNILFYFDQFSFKWKLRANPRLCSLIFLHFLSLFLQFWLPTPCIHHNCDCLYKFLSQFLERIIGFYDVDINLRLTYCFMKICPLGTLQLHHPNLYHQNFYHPNCQRTYHWKWLFNQPIVDIFIWLLRSWLLIYQKYPHLRYLSYFLITTISIWLPTQFLLECIECLHYFHYLQNLLIYQKWMNSTLKAL